MTWLTMVLALLSLMAMVRASSIPEVNTPRYDTSWSATNFTTGVPIPATSQAVSLVASPYTKDECASTKRFLPYGDFKALSTSSLSRLDLLDYPNNYASYVRATDLLVSEMATALRMAPSLNILSTETSPTITSSSKWVSTISVVVTEDGVETAIGTKVQSFAEPSTTIPGTDTQIRTPLSIAQITLSPLFVEPASKLLDGSTVDSSSTVITTPDDYPTRHYEAAASPASALVETGSASKSVIFPIPAAAQPADSLITSSTASRVVTMTPSFVQPANYIITSSKTTTTSNTATTAMLPPGFSALLSAHPTMNGPSFANEAFRFPPSRTDAKLLAAAWSRPTSTQAIVPVNPESSESQDDGALPDAPLDKGESASGQSSGINGGSDQGNGPSDSSRGQDAENSEIAVQQSSDSASQDISSSLRAIQQSVSDQQQSNDEAATGGEQSSDAQAHDTDAGSGDLSESNPGHRLVDVLNEVAGSSNSNKDVVIDVPSPTTASKYPSPHSAGHVLTVNPSTAAFGAATTAVRSTGSTAFTITIANFPKPASTQVSRTSGDSMSDSDVFTDTQQAPGPIATTRTLDGSMAASTLTPLMVLSSSPPTATTMTTQVNNTPTTFVLLLPSGPSGQRDGLIVTTAYRTTGGSTVAFTLTQPQLAQPKVPTMTTVAAGDGTFILTLPFAMDSTQNDPLVSTAVRTFGTSILSFTLTGLDSTPASGADKTTILRTLDNGSTGTFLITLPAASPYQSSTSSSLGIADFIVSGLGGAAEAQETTSISRSSDGGSGPTLADGRTSKVETTGGTPTASAVTTSASATTSSLATVSASAEDAVEEEEEEESMAASSLQSWTGVWIKGRALIVPIVLGAAFMV